MRQKPETAVKSNPTHGPKGDREAMEYYVGKFLFMLTLVRLRRLSKIHNVNHRCRKLELVERLQRYYKTRHKGDYEKQGLSCLEVLFLDLEEIDVAQIVQALSESEAVNCDQECLIKRLTAAANVSDMIASVRHDLHRFSAEELEDICSSIIKRRHDSDVEGSVEVPQIDPQIREFQLIQQQQRENDGAPTLARRRKAPSFTFPQLADLLICLWLDNRCLSFQESDDCPVCMDNRCNCLIMPCLHKMCKLCQDQMMFVRDRHCPICRKTRRLCLPLLPPISS